MTTGTGTSSEELSISSRPGFRSLRTEMREIPREECLDLLSSHRFGRLALVMPGGHPAIRPINYIFDRASQSVVFRTARGSKLYAVLHAARAAFEIDGVDESTETGWSVILEGVTAEVTSPMIIAHLELRKLRPWAPGHKPHWVQIRARSVSGRRIALSPDEMAGYYLG